MTQYIPYSIRNNITDPDLAGLLDFCEREMGWDIETDYPEEVFGFSIKSNGWKLHIDIEATGTCFIVKTTPKGIETHYEIFIERFRMDIFFRTYKTLLPVIRDLYGK